MKTAILASLIASAAAFAPSQQTARTSVATQAFEDDVGATAPLGFFDPLGLVADGDEQKFNRLRYTEIKHGRICMLAVVGYLFTYAGVRFPGEIAFGTKFEDIPAGLDAFGAIPTLGLIQIVGFIGFLETYVMKDITGTAEFPGDLRNDWIGISQWDALDAETQAKKRALEINQGRAAMMGILGLMVHEKLGVSLLPDPDF